MKWGMTIEYLKCRADFNFEVDFGVNDVIGTIVTKWDLIFYLNNRSFSSTIYIFLINMHHMHLTRIKKIPTIFYSLIDVKM